MQICSKYLDFLSDFERKIEIQIESSNDIEIYYDVVIYPWIMDKSECTCQGFKYRHTCSHIEIARENYFCEWNQIDCEDKQNEHQREQHICPRCQAPTRDI